MHYYVEKTIEHRLDDAMRAHRNATFVRELRRLRQGDGRGVFATLICRLTNWTPLDLCVELPGLRRQPCLESAAEARASWRSSAETRTGKDGRSLW